MLYGYRNSRSGQCPVDYLQGCAGYLQVDGYAAYGQTGAALAGCWAHARRKSVEAKQAQVKGKVGKAIAYTPKQWPKLVRHFGHGELNIDNNRAERAIKPFVIGRKNWLFANTAKGAQASATLYSLIETAKANGLPPFGHIKHLLERPDGLEGLMPWHIKRLG